MWTNSQEFWNQKHNLKNFERSLWQDKAEILAFIDASEFETQALITCYIFSSMTSLFSENDNTASR